ncbi:MAG: hypothetical protein A3E83_02100 [Gammaproteobacteria bacterium RIFCSPHIGHO2_12_FULL_41_20]|nr:MAG: hypothetical protein A3E83_02100 [Gammaproteobacteria bacterium RIFCSPHIGHO2_12_FULL_41_20]
MDPIPSEIYMYKLPYKITVLLVFILTGCVNTIHPISNDTATHKPTLPQESVRYFFANDPTFWQSNPSSTWIQLQHIPVGALETAQSSDVDPERAAWMQLAIISKRYSTNTKQLTQELITWRERYPSHPGNTLFPDDATLSRLFATPSPKHIALLLPIQGKLAPSGQMVRDGFFNGYYQATSKGEDQAIDFYDTSKAPVQTLYQKAMTKGADFIVGPLSKEEVQAISKINISIPTLALNYTESPFGGLPKNLYEFGLLPEDETLQMAKKAQQLGHSQAIIIAPQDKWGSRMATALSKQWQAEGGYIRETWYFTEQTDFTTAIAELLHINRDTDKKLMKRENNKMRLAQQRRQDFDIIFLLAPLSSARQIVPLLRYYYADNIPIYATSETYSTRNSAANMDLNGVTICGTPWTLRASHANNDKQTSLYALGRDAYLLSHELPRLLLLPYFPIYGATGMLTEKAHEIHRQLPCATIQNGQTAL